MNETRKEKLKRLIMKLPLGPQLLQLRRHFILQNKKKKQKKILRHQEREKVLEQQKRERKIALEHKKRERKIVLRNKAKLQNYDFYYKRNIKTLEVFRRYVHVSTESPIAFEIGAGLYLIAPIGLSLLGFEKVITVDVQRAIPDDVQTVYRYYRKHKKRFGVHHIPKIKGKFTDENLTDILWRNFNIDYRAPYDAAHTDLSDNSVDYVFSHVTFEHIRAEILPNIVKESFRILRVGGVMYVTIDYQDHRAFLASELTIYDYLQYTTAEWPQHDSKSHQNRLRTADYQKMFIDAGFEVVSLHKQKITDADRAAFATVKVADEFKNKYTDEELMEKGAWFVLRKPIK